MERDDILLVLLGPEGTHKRAHNDTGQQTRKTRRNYVVGVLDLAVSSFFPSVCFSL